MSGAEVENDRRQRESCVLMKAKPPTLTLAGWEHIASAADNVRGSYWVPGWWEEVWVACLQDLCDSRRGDGASRPPCVRTLEYGGTGSGQPLGADRRCQVLRPGTPASLAGGCSLPRMRQRYRGPRRL